MVSLSLAPMLLESRPTPLMPSFPFWEVAPKSGEPALISTCSLLFSNTLCFGLIQLQHGPDFPFGKWLISLYTGSTSHPAYEEPFGGSRRSMRASTGIAESLAWM